MGSLCPKAEIATYFKFADDVVIAIEIKDPSPMEAHIKSELNHIECWRYEHGLKLNTTKTKLMIIKKAK